MNSIAHKFLRSRGGSKFGQTLNFSSFLEEAASKKMVFVGEVHAVSQVVALQAEI